MCEKDKLKSIDAASRLKYLSLLSKTINFEKLSGLYFDEDNYCDIVLKNNYLYIIFLNKKTDKIIAITSSVGLGNKISIKECAYSCKTNGEIYTTDLLNKFCLPLPLETDTTTSISKLIGIDPTIFKCVNAQPEFNGFTWTAGVRGPSYP